MHRFFLGHDAALNGESFVAHSQVAHQIAVVLRLRTGERITVLDHAGQLYVVELVHVSRNEVRGRVVSQKEAGGEPRTHITLYQALLKGERFEWVLQKCTEIGVSTFVPVLCERSVARTDDSKHKQSRWERIVREAAEQAGRGRIPTVAPLCTFAAACEQAQANGERGILAWEGERSRSIKSVLRIAGVVSERLQLFTGPEGGFSAGEAQMAQASGIVPVTLGARILRAETAGLVASTIILYEYGDMDAGA